MGRLLGRLRRPSLGDLGSWLLAFGGAVALWLFVNSGERTTERTLRIRLEPQNLPSGFVITNNPPDRIDVLVSGSGIILSSIDTKRLRQYLDLSGVRPGVATFSLGGKLLQLPRKVEVLRVTPSQVSFHIDRIGKRTVPVRLQRSNELDHGLKLRDLSLHPDRVEVLGPESQLDTVKAVDTEVLELIDIPVGKSDRVLRLIKPGERFRLATGEVTATLDVEEPLVSRELPGLPVDLGEAVGAWIASPRTVNVLVRGPERTVAELEIPDDLVRAAPLPGVTGKHKVKPEIQLPDGVQLVSLEPPEVALVPTVGAEASRGGADNRNRPRR